MSYRVIESVSDCPNNRDYVWTYHVVNIIFITRVTEETIRYRKVDFINISKVWWLLVRVFINDSTITLYNT